MKIATYPGTGTEIVARVMRSMGDTVIQITNLRIARTAPFDALILLGGADISPLFYGEVPTHCHGIDRNRDAVEWTLVRRALDRQVPIMGICRGHQMLAVASGGSLYQDIESMGATDHHPFGFVHRLARVEQPLAARLPTTLVNSLHHQAIRTVPAGFEVLAYSKDAIVEAIWRPGALGVQFHPELLCTQDRRWAGLFEWLHQGLLAPNRAAPGPAGTCISKVSAVN